MNKRNSTKDERRAEEIVETLSKMRKEKEPLAIVGASNKRGGQLIVSHPHSSEREHHRRRENVREKLEAFIHAMLTKILASFGQKGGSVLGPWLDELLSPGGIGSFSDLHPMPYGNLSGGSTPWVGSITLEVIQPAGYAGWIAISPVFANNTPAITYTNSSYAQPAGAMNAAGAIPGTTSVDISNLAFTSGSFNPNTVTGAGAAAKAKFRHVKVSVENVTAEINRASWGFIGSYPGGVDCLGTTLDSYDTLRNAGQCRDLDILKEGDTATEIFMSPFEEDYEFPDEQYPFPRYSAVQTLDVDEKWKTSQGYPIFAYFAPCSTTQSYRVRVEMGVEYLAASTQFTGATLQQIPTRRPPPHVPEAINVIPAIMNAKQKVPSANTKHHASFSKHVKDFFGKVGHFFKDPTHDIEVALGLGGAKGAAGALVDAIGDLGVFAI